MLPVDFAESNGVLGKPDCMTDEQCSDLPIHRFLDQENFPQIISCWQFSKEDLEEIRRTGKIWVQTVGITLSPFCLFTENPFQDEKKI
jgi:hypothetical protein